MVDSRDTEITLITYSRDGAEIREKKIEVFAGEKSANRQEFYGAYAVGLRVSRIFSVHSEDFELSRKDVPGQQAVYASALEHNGTRYNILRTFTDGEKETTEIMCG